MNRYQGASFVIATMLFVQMAGCGDSGGKPRGGTASSPAPTTASSPAGTAAPAASSSPAGTAAPAVTTPAASPRTAQDVLEKMVEAYRNAASYEDFGSLEFRTDPTQAQSETRFNFSVAFARPNKVRATLFGGQVVCDGKQWCATCDSTPGQAVLREAPPRISMDMFRADYLLYSALTDGGQRTSPPLELLLDKDPIKGLVNGSQDVALDEPGKLGDFDCYRVRVNLPEGPEYLWIDQKTFVLRMLVLPINVAQPGSAEGQSNRMWLVISFERARLGGDIDPTAFRFDIGEGVKKTRALMQTGPYDLLGQKLPEFKFVDLQGKPWSSQSLAGKAAVLHFWGSGVTEGHPLLANVEQLHAKYKDNDKVAVLAVSLDSPDAPAKTIEEAGKKLGLSLPMVRDNGMEARDKLKLVGPPVTLFIDAQGVLQDCILGANAVAAAAAPRKLEKLLAGEDLAKRALEEFRQQTREYEKAVDAQFSGEAQSATVEQAKATPIAPRSEPARLKLKRLWNCAAIHPAGNIVVIQPPGGKPRIFVIDGFRAVSEIDADGKVVGRCEPKLAAEEFFISLRSATGKDGHVYLVAFAPTGQRFHLFDEKLACILSYPIDALENRHAGIGDVALGDLEGDGTIKAYVGFAGTVGVKCVSLQGTVNWSCRNLFNVSGVAPGPANPQGQRELFCVNDASNVAMLDSKGQVRDATRLVTEGGLRTLVHADIAGNGREVWCGVTFAADPQQTSGQFTAVGLSPGGEVLWKYPLPSGTQQAAEPVVVGRVLPGTASQWLLPGSDGSIHILAADGSPIDRFHYGTQVGGLATMEIDGKRVLLIGSAQGVEALQVE